MQHTKFAVQWGEPEVCLILITVDKREQLDVSIRMQTLMHCVSETVQSLPPPPCTTCPTLLKQTSAWDGQSSCFWPLQVPPPPPPAPNPTAQPAPTSCMIKAMQTGLPYV